MYPTAIKPKRNKSLILFVVFLCTTIVLCIMLIASVFVYYTFYSTSSNTGSNTTTVTTSNPNSKYAFLVDQKCKDDKEYSNVVTPSTDISAYSTDYFYSRDVKGITPAGKISANEKLLVELMYWEDDTVDALKYDARAVVCVKNENKVATVSFNSSQVTFDAPIRYKDPERKISKILVQAVYIVASDATSKSDWKDRIDANLKNIVEAQKRIYNNKSSIDYVIYPEAVKNNELNRDFLTKVAKGIVAKENENDQSNKPKLFLESSVYTNTNKTKYPAFFKSDAEIANYDQVSTLVYFEVGDNSRALSTRNFESGYAYVYPVMKNGNFLAIIGVNLSKDISLQSTPYHEFTHTLGLPDEYQYTDGTVQRKPTHVFKGVSESFATLMEDPSEGDLTKTYIDDQERYMMGIKD